jgi:hypothetical protein
VFAFFFSRRIACDNATGYPGRFRQEAGGCHRRVVRVRERIAPNADKKVVHALRSKSEEPFQKKKVKFAAQGVAVKEEVDGFVAIV